MAIRIRARARPGLLWAPRASGPSSVLPPSRISLSNRLAPGRAAAATKWCRGLPPRDATSRDRAGADARSAVPGRGYFASASPSVFFGSSSASAALASAASSAGSSAASFLPRSMALSSSAAASAVGLVGRSARRRRPGRRGRRLQVVLDAVDDAVVLLVVEDGADGVLREERVRRRGPTSRRTVSSLTSLTVAYMPPMVRTPVPGCMSLRICAACLLLLLGGPGHQEHGPDEHDEREEGHEYSRDGIPSHDRAGERPDVRGCGAPTERAASAESKRVRTMEQRPAWHRGS